MALLLGGALALGLEACSATPHTISQTPAGIELSCTGCSSQLMADTAQAHCRANGMDAQLHTVIAEDGLAHHKTFDCVSPGLSQAPR